MRTLSKLGLAGLRLGMLIGRPEWLAELDKLRLPYNVNVLTQRIAAHVLRATDVLRRAGGCDPRRSARGCRRAAIAAGRDARFRAMPISFCFVCRDADAVFAGLKTRGVLIKNLNGSHPSLTDCLRVTVGTPEENAQFLERSAAKACARPPELLSSRLANMRQAQVTRNTLETQISVKLDLDGTGKSALSTGIGFFDHMLDQVARHGMLDLEIAAKGDLHIDAHHTVEDVGITLGQAFAQALGDKKGMRRYGHAYVPLDEALSRVVIDLSGRPGLEFNVDFSRALIGEFDVDLIHEFFRASSTTRW